MNWLVTALVTALGAGLVLVVLRDLFHTLGHPGGHGSMSRLVMGTVWRLSGRTGRHGRLAGLAGPASLLAVVGAWGVLAVTGWALIYLPEIPAGFTFADGRPPGPGDAPLDALYFSMVMISTLGLGDIAPVFGWLRVVAPLEALFGFALLTVAVSWVLQIYPALTRRRVLAIRLRLLRDAGALDALRDLDSAMSSWLLAGLATDIVQVRVDLHEYTETYYFHEDQPGASLAGTLRYAAELGEAGAASGRADTRLAAAVLNRSLDDLAGVLDEKFLHLGGTVIEIIDAYAADHGRAG